MRRVSVLAVIALGLLAAAPATAAIYQCQVKHERVVVLTSEPDPKTVYLQVGQTLQTWNPKTRAWVKFCRGGGPKPLCLTNTETHGWQFVTEYTSAGERVRDELRLDTSPGSFRHQVLKGCAPGAQPGGPGGKRCLTVYESEGTCKPSSGP
jgi:hypothetical protein